MNSEIDLFEKNKKGADKWVKLICGASNEDIVAIEDLCAIYSAAGVDYIDVAADQSIAQAARTGIEWAKQFYGSSPGLMISISDGNDIHFRKAKFDPLKCPLTVKDHAKEFAQPLLLIIMESKSKCYGCVGVLRVALQFNI